MIQTAEFMADEQKAIKKKKAKLNQSDLIPVRINAKTFILIRPGKDPQTAKQRFIEKLNKADEDRIIRGRQYNP